MTNRQELIVKNVDQNKQMILDAERWLWAHPQTGYTEWEANGYLTEKFEALGYELHQAGNIPGFYTDVKTGKPGPTLAIFGDRDPYVNLPVTLPMLPRLPKGSAVECISGAAHVAMYEQPYYHDFQQRLLRYLND